MTEAEDGLRPVRMEIRSLPEEDEASILKRFFKDMEQLTSVQLVPWGGFHTDLPQILIAAMDAGLRLPANDIA